MIDCFPLPRGSFWKSAPYGQRRSTGVHRGVDYAANTGTPLHAPVAGVISVPAFEANGAGSNIWIRGDDGRTWKFFHMSRIDVRTGQRVSAGQLVGAVGSTGRSSGPHLHIELHDTWPPAHAIDPTNDLDRAVRYPDDAPTRPAAPTPPPTKEEWMGKPLRINGEDAQWRLVDDGYGAVMRQWVPSTAHLSLYRKAELIEGDAVVLTDQAEIETLRALPQASGLPNDAGALRLTVSIIKEVQARSGTVDPANIDVETLTREVANEIARRMAS